MSQSTTVNGYPPSAFKYYLLNARKSCHWYHLDDPENRMELHNFCQFSGPVSLTFHADDDLACDQPLALVENLDVVHHPERMAGREHFVSLLYYQGRLSDSLLRWLSFRPRAPEIWLFPEYDLPGISNYLRLKQLLPELKLYLPPQLETLLISHGSEPRLSTGSPCLTAEQIEQSGDGKALTVLQAITKTGKGLSQQALLDPF